VVGGVSIIKFIFMYEYVIRFKAFCQNSLFNSFSFLYMSFTVFIKLGRINTILAIIPSHDPKICELQKVSIPYSIIIENDQFYCNFEISRVT
jgi:hypothetical protein